LVKISVKNDKFGYLNPILEKLWVMHNLVDGLFESLWSTFYSP